MTCFKSQLVLQLTFFIIYKSFSNFKAANKKKVKKKRNLILHVFCIGTSDIRNLNEVAIAISAHMRNEYTSHTQAKECK